MKLTDFLSDVGRPVAYYPALRRITGSTNATILLCQFIYWRGKESDPNGWLYKESDEIEQETGLSYGEQKTARRNLLEAGLIEEHYARLDHQMKFRLNLEAINEKWGNEDNAIPESGKPQLGNDAKPLSLTETEITAENTTEPFFTAEEQAQNEAKMQAILELERKASEAVESGTAWRGRELLPPHYIQFGDWWYSQTGMQMYGAKAKAKMDAVWLKELQKWHENDLTVFILQNAYNHVIAWKKVVSKMSDITATAISMQAADEKATSSIPAVKVDEAGFPESY